jgi:ABC-type transporter Mla MlaB component
VLDFEGMQMTDSALSTDSPLVERTQGHPCRDRSPASGRPDESIRLAGVFDRASGDVLQAAAQRWRTACPLVPFAATAHVDMSDVTQLDPAGFGLLNEVYRQAHDSGWAFRVTPPADLDARLGFLRAVVDRNLEWA